VLLRRSELKVKDNPALSIERSNISITEGLTLGNGEAIDVRVTIAGIKKPGDYEGYIEFLLPVTTPTVVSSLSPNVRLKLVRCWGFDCELAKWFFGPNVLSDSVSLQFTNTSPVEAKLDATHSDAFLIGENSGAELGTGNLTQSQAQAIPPLRLSQAQAIPPQQTGRVQLTINRSLLTPEHYQGTARVVFENADTPIAVSVDVFVRAGPLMPLVVAVFGIILGSLLRGMETPRAQMEQSLLPNAQRLRDRADQLSDETARMDMCQQVDRLLNQIENGQATVEALKPVVDQLRTKLDLLDMLAGYQKNLEQTHQQSPVPQHDIFVDRIRKAQTEVLRPDLNPAQVEATIRGIYTDLRAIPAVATRGGIKAPDRISLPAGTPTQEDEGQPITQRDRIACTLRSLLSWRPSAFFRVNILYPVLRLIVLFLLALLGLQSLYVNAGASFGVGGVYDYLGLLFWGFTAKVAVGSLKLPEKNSG
jgi:hypothetical protein